MKHLALLATLTVAIATPASAQHFWLDVNGDGLCTSADVLSPSVTTVDVWVDTDTNQDGSPAACTTGSEGMTIGSYSIVITAPMGGVAYMVWGDYMGFNATSFGFQDNDCWITRIAPAYLPAGTYKLAALVVQVTGNPVLQFAASTTYDSAAVTGFTSQCAGADGDYLSALQTDFMGACGTSLPTPVHEMTWGQIKSLYR